MNKFTLPLLIPFFMFNSCSSTLQTSGISVHNLDTSVVPGNDFYHYACGGWMRAHPLSGEYSRFGSFDLLRENNLNRLSQLITTIAKENASNGTIQQKIGDLYNLAMDSSKLNSDGYKPIMNDLNKVSSVKSSTELINLLPNLLLNGIDAYFTISVDADPMNSRVNLLQTHQSGLSLGERDYYLDTDSSTLSIIRAYEQHVKKMFRLIGYSSAQSDVAATSVLYIETRLAKIAYDNVKLRDPQLNYHKVSVSDLQKLVPSISWDIFFKSLGINSVNEVSVSQLEPLVEVGTILNTVSLSIQQDYLKWKIIDASADYLSDDFSTQNFKFYGKILSGKQVERPRWKRSVDVVNEILGEAVGQMYVKKYFSPAAKKRMLEIVSNLQLAFKERITNLSWMSDTTKFKALEKLSAFYVKIGYPDKWRDYSSLSIQSDSYYANIKRSNIFERQYNFSKVSKPVDRDEWLMMPQTVNAYYNPSTNEICFPAGILQPPFFDMNADDAFNYGAIGVVIGHEMTHGFDDQGCLYDKDGNLKNWWNASDKQNFDMRAKVMSDFFSRIEVLPGVLANGKFTLGENIADHGGLQISYTAFLNVLKSSPLLSKEGFTPQQRFFLSYANVWSQNIRNEEIMVRTKSDPHSLGEWRVNGALPHIQPWYDAFGINTTHSMYLQSSDRVSIW